MNKNVSFRRRLLKTVGSEKRAICFSTLNPNEQQTIRCDFVTNLNINLQYSTNGVDFQTYTNGQEITFGGDDKVWFRGKNQSFTYINSGFSNFKLLDDNVLTRCDGNIMHLLDYEQDLNVCEGTRAFQRLFMDCTALYSCPDILVETLNGEACFTETFLNCINLKYVPKIKVKNFNSISCFSTIFKNCTNLEGEVDLTVNSVYDISQLNSVFYGTKISKANIRINVNYVPEKCFKNMFCDCTNLEEVNISGNINLGNNAFSNCFDGCSNLKTFNADSDYTLNINSVDAESLKNMFLNCIKLETININLNAQTLFYSCYHDMFRGCSSITNAPELPATTLDQNCYAGMFRNCSSLINAPELPAVILKQYCYDYMFDGCTNLIVAPELPATTLAPYCYRYMFRNCNKVNNIKCLAEDLSATDCTVDWLNNVSSTGTFIKKDGVQWDRDASGIPTNWIVENVSGTILDLSLTKDIISEKYGSQLNIESDINWEVFSYPNWVQLDKLSGSGNDVINVQYVDDQQGKLKTGIILVKNLTTNTTEQVNLYGLNTVKQELTFIPRTWGSLRWQFNINRDPNPKTIEYTKDGGITWTSITSSDDNSLNSIDYSVGDIISFRGNNAAYASDNNIGSIFSDSSHKINIICGNIMSLIDSANFENLTQLTQPFAFHALFKGFDLKDASNLSLPATILTQSCYRGMFDNCKNLLYAPDLLASQLVQDCYRYMFYGCVSLIYIKCLCDTTINNDTYTQKWVEKAKNTNECKFVKKSTTQIYRSGSSGIPNNWVIENV